MDEIPNSAEETQFYKEIMNKARERKYYYPQIVLTCIDKVEQKLEGVEEDFDSFARNVRVVVAVVVVAAVAVDVDLEARACS